MKRFKSRRGSYIALLDGPGKPYSVIVTACGVSSFAGSWPCCRLSGDNPIRFDFASNGDLVGVSTSVDGSEVVALSEIVALSEDAQRFGERIMKRMNAD